MPRGGTPPKKTGRPRGSRNRRTIEMQALATDGISPAEYLLSVMRDESRPEEERIRAAGLVAPYVYAKPKQLAQTVHVTIPELNTIEAIAEAAAIIASAAAEGRIDLGSAKELSNLIELARKSFETRDIERRLQALETAGFHDGPPIIDGKETSRAISN